MTRVILGETSFDTKRQAEKYFALMLQYGPFDVRVAEPAATDLRNLFHRHPKVIAKRRVTEIDYFVIRETIHGAHGFEIVWQDGSADIWSFYGCLGPPRTLQRRIADAMRLEVEEEIWRRKQAYFAEHGDPFDRSVPCALTGMPLTILQANADHVPPWTFAKIRNAFVALRAQDFGSDPVVDGELRECLKDRALADVWCNFHWERAAIRYISGPANRALAREGAPSRTETQLSFAGLLSASADCAAT